MKKTFVCLAFAAAVFVAGCKKPYDNPLSDREYNCMELPLSYDVYLYFSEMYKLNLQLNKLLSEEPIIDTIYLVPVSTDRWGSHFSNETMPRLKERLDEILNISPKRLRGRGAFEFHWGVGSEEDVKWFNKRGWEVRVISYDNND